MRIFHRTPPEAHASPVLFSDHGNLDRIEPQLDEPVEQRVCRTDNGLDSQVSNLIASIGLRLLRWFGLPHSWRHRGQKSDHFRAFDGRAHELEGNHGDEIAQNYAHEVGDTLLWLELKFQNDLILVHSRPFVTRTAQILKRLNRLLRGNITRV